MLKKTTAGICYDTQFSQLLLVKSSTKVSGGGCGVQSLWVVRICKAKEWGSVKFVNRSVKSSAMFTTIQFWVLF